MCGFSKYRPFFELLSTSSGFHITFSQFGGLRKKRSTKLKEPKEKVYRTMNIPSNRDACKDYSKKIYIRKELR